MYAFRQIRLLRHPDGRFEILKDKHTSRNAPLSRIENVIRHICFSWRRAAPGVAGQPRRITGRLLPFPGSGDDATLPERSGHR